MVRDLVWLQNFSFAAWGCSKCGWIIPTGPAVSAKASAPVCAAFAKHNCRNFPRHSASDASRNTSSKEKRPARRVEF